jgi:hypothetical protein
MEVGIELRVEMLVRNRGAGAGLVSLELVVEVLAVRACLHGNLKGDIASSVALTAPRRAEADREDTLDNKVVEFLERVLITRRERGRELLGGLLLSVGERLCSEVESTEKPHQALGCRALLAALELVLDHLLECSRLSGVRGMAGADFL